MLKAVPIAVLKLLGLEKSCRHLLRRLRSKATASPEAAMPLEGPGTQESTGAPVAPMPEVLLEPLPPLESGSLADRVKKMVDHAQFKRLIQALHDWPQASTIAASERALLHWFITAHDMQNVLEIGTYFAGTTQLMAASLEAKGSGTVYTVDPYGAERGPKAFREWPEALTRRLVFEAKYSSEYLLVMNNLPTFDLVLVDGNHSYANALHDMSASVENCASNGFLIIDNAEQPDVIDATRDFLTLNPHFESILIGQRGMTAFCSDVFEFDGEESCFVVIGVDRNVIRPNKTCTYFAFGLPGLSLGELRLSFKNKRPLHGAFSITTHLRATPSDNRVHSEMFDFFHRKDIELTEEAEGSIAIPLPLSLPERAANHVKWGEFSLTYKSKNETGCDGVSLRLDGRELRMGWNFIGP